MVVVHRRRGEFKFLCVNGCFGQGFCADKFIEEVSLARYLGPACRLCRREGQKLFLKGERCIVAEKCSFERRSYPPGGHGYGRRPSLSEYGVQLREKQKVRRVYGLLEKQFKKIFYNAAKRRGITSENFFKSLEFRLDNVVYRMGFARSRNEARQVLRHNHIFLNGKKVNIPSIIVRVGDEISVRPKSQDMSLFSLAKEQYVRRAKLNWFEVDHNKFSGKILAETTRDDIHMNVKERLIVELYSK